MNDIVKEIINGYFKNLYIGMKEYYKKKGYKSKDIIKIEGGNW